MSDVRRPRRVHVCRVYDLETGQVHAVCGASDAAGAFREARKTQRQHPEAWIQMYHRGRWRPWLGVAKVDG